jgi:hypothetical protein
VSESAQEKLASAEDAVVALETHELCALIDDPCAMAEAVISRQYALDYLKSHPLSDVSEPRRGALRQRLEAVQANDARAMQLLSEVRGQVNGQLDNLVSGRAAVRGYGGLSTADLASYTGVKRRG